MTKNLPNRKLPQNPAFSCNPTTSRPLSRRARVLVVDQATRPFPSLFHRSAYCTAAKVFYSRKFKQTQPIQRKWRSPNALLTLVKRQLPPARNCLGLRLIEARLVCLNPWSLDLNKCTRGKHLYRYVQQVSVSDDACPRITTQLKCSEAISSAPPPCRGARSWRRPAAWRRDPPAPCETRIVRSRLEPGRTAAACACACPRP